ncbi:MAG: dihydroorotase [Fibrobacteria bacterium]|nr:dihydroorotase [Fibrobacteria bacterium]
MHDLVLRLPDDFHVHLRQDADLPAYAREARDRFGRVLVMPNLAPAVLRAEDVIRYRQAIVEAAPGLEPLMAFKLTPRHEAVELRELAEAGAVAGKVYPEGVTTNSEDGIHDLRQIWPLMEVLEETGLLVCCHGEKPGAFSLDREERFLDEFCETASRFPGVKFVLEHVSTAAAVRAVGSLGRNVAATLTLHHLEITLDDVVGGMLKPHLFCKPLAKRPEDREALRQAAFSGSPKFFYGTDSAPHHKGKKECAAGCAGVYSMPVALEGLVDVFDRAGELDRLEDFCSSFGADFYGIPRSTRTITLHRSPWNVPDLVDGVVPYRAGETMPWRIASVSDS